MCWVDNIIGLCVNLVGFVGGLIWICKVEFEWC